MRSGMDALPERRWTVSSLVGTPQERSMGGRHCPSYVRGWDPHKDAWVERIYYAGSAENLWGPYTIGFLEWDGEQWQEQPEPAFGASEDWEHGSVYEPNLVYHEGKWKLWYVAGSNHEDYLVHGYSESTDGRSGWTHHTVFATPEMKMFDFCVRERDGGFEAVFARVWMGRGEMPPETGLWWCRAQESADPGGVANHAAEVPGNELWILVREHIRLHIAKSRVWFLANAVVERLKDVFLKVRGAGVLGDNRIADLVRIVAIFDTEHVHFHACNQEGDYRVHVLGNPRGSMQCDGSPYGIDVLQ